MVTSLRIPEQPAKGSAASSSCSMICFSGTSAIPGLRIQESPLQTTRVKIVYKGSEILLGFRIRVKSLYLGFCQVGNARGTSVLATSVWNGAQNLGLGVWSSCSRGKATFRRSRRRMKLQASCTWLKALHNPKR